MKKQSSLTVVFAVVYLLVVVLLSAQLLPSEAAPPPAPSESFVEELELPESPPNGPAALGDPPLELKEARVPMPILASSVESVSNCSSGNHAAVEHCNMNGVDVIRVDLNDPSVTIKPVIAPNGGLATLSTLAGPDGIAAINGDYRLGSCTNGVNCGEGLTYTYGTNYTMGPYDTYNYRRSMAFNQSLYPHIGFPSEQGGYLWHVLGGGPRFTDNGAFSWVCGDGTQNKDCPNENGTVTINLEYFGPTATNWWNRPQSAIGFSEDGSIIYLAASQGNVTMQSLHDVLWQLGSRNNIKLDGGSARSLYYNDGPGHYLYLGSGIVEPNAWVIVPNATPPSGNWDAKYMEGDTCWWDTNCGDLNSPKCTETIGGPELHKDWGSNAPCGGGMDGDNWVGNFEATINFPTGNYAFHVDHDDGLKMWLNGQNITDRGDSGSTYVCGGPNGYALSGDESLRVLLREQTGVAKVHLNWTTDTSYCQSDEPDLHPYTPTGYASPVVPSSITGTKVVNTLYAGDPTYFDWHFINSGTGVASNAFYVDLWVDDTRYVHYPYTNYDPGRIGGFDDWMETISEPGLHTVRLVIDPGNSVAESDESNNEWQQDFYWEPSTPDQPTLENPPSLTSFLEGDKITFTWSGNGDEYYAEYRDYPNGLYASSSGWQTTTSWDVGQLHSGYVYSWRVKARNSFGESPWSKENIFTVRPIAPWDLVGQSLNCDEVELYWLYNDSNSHDGFSIYRDGVRIQRIYGTTFDARHFVDRSVNEKTRYRYYISAFGGTGVESAASNVIDVETPSCNDPPVLFPNLIPGDLDGDGDVDLIDFGKLVLDYGKTGKPGFIPADVNFDGDVDIFDFNIIVSNYGMKRSSTSQQTSVFRYTNTVPDPPGNLTLVRDVQFSTDNAAIITLSWDDYSDNGEGFELAWRIDSHIPITVTMPVNTTINTGNFPNQTGHNAHIARISCEYYDRSPIINASVNTFNADGASNTVSVSERIVVSACPGTSRVHLPFVVTSLTKYENFPVELPVLANDNISIPLPDFPVGE